MTPTNFRNATFESLRGSLDGLRRQAYHAWVAHGPGTTREVSQRCGMDILTFRPRTTELIDMGLVVVSDDQQSKREGRYKVADKSTWEVFRQAKTEGQLILL